MVAAVGRDQFAALGLVRVLPVVKPLFQGLRDGFALADFVLLVVGRGRRQPSFRYDKRRLWSAAVVSALGHFVPKYQPVMKSRRANLAECSLSTSHSAMAGTPKGETRNARTRNTIPPTVCPPINRIRESSVSTMQPSSHTADATQNRNVTIAASRDSATITGAARILRTMSFIIVKESPYIKETYTDEELLTLLAKPDADCKFCEYRNWVIVNFLLNSGCRAATVRNIQNQDVDLSRRQIVLRHTKNGKVQVIPLCSAMVSILRDYMAVREGESSDYLFCNEFGGFLTENALRLAIVKYNNSRGVERTSIHAFRHTFARKYLVDCGGDAFSLQQIMGHSTLKMTRHYCNLFNDDIIENHEQHSPLAQLTRSKRQTIKK